MKAAFDKVIAAMKAQGFDPGADRKKNGIFCITTNNSDACDAGLAFKTGKIKNKSGGEMTEEERTRFNTMLSQLGLKPLASYTNKKDRHFCGPF